MREPLRCKQSEAQTPWYPSALCAASLRHWRPASFILTILLGLAIARPAAIEAQTISFAGAQSIVPTGAFNPEGVAMDGLGNLFVLDINKVLKVSSDGTQTTVLSINAPSAPLGIAADRAGNVFVSVEGLGPGYVVKISPTVDGAGNLNIAEGVDNIVVKVSSDGTQSHVGSGLRFPQGIAVDGAGDLFIADTSNQRVLKVQPSAVKFASAHWLGELCAASTCRPSEQLV